MLAASVASDRLTSDWQLAVVPTRPEYWMATPTECWPLLSRVVSSTIQCSMAPRFCITGTTRPSTRSRTGPSFQLASLTKCWIAWCRRETPDARRSAPCSCAHRAATARSCSRSARADAHRCPQPRPDPRHTLGSAAPSRHRNSVLRSCPLDKHPPTQRNQLNPIYQDYSRDAVHLLPGDPDRLQGHVQALVGQVRRQGEVSRGLRPLR